ncbi:hypothetical protein KJ750_01965 [Patescibacteria group bacterium]|nr:hypothetical protein [Patescibacteria group bacterium]
MPEQISRENWEQSENKWVEIIRKTRNREKFSNHNGFTNLDAERKCGYCEQFYGLRGSLWSSCLDCPLYKKNICDNLFYDNRIRGNFLFYQYLDEMRKSLYGRKVSWGKAFNYAIKILAAIRDDEPID